MPKNDERRRLDRIFNPEKIVRKNGYKTIVLKTGQGVPYGRTATWAWVGRLNIRKIDKRVTFSAKSVGKIAPKRLTNR